MLSRADHGLALLCFVQMGAYLSFLGWPFFFFGCSYVAICVPKLHLSSSPGLFSFLGVLVSFLGAPLFCYFGTAVEGQITAYGRRTTYCTIWLKNTSKLRQNCTRKTRHRRRTKLAAALRAAANLGVGDVAFFVCKFGVISA